MAAEPRLWILSKGRKGDLDQMLALTEAVGWPHEVKRLAFSGPEIPALAPILLKAESDPLTPPWPDVVMCAEALPCAVARKLKRQSGGRIRTVCLGRPAGDAAAFDLVLTTAQYRLPRARNIVELQMPLAGAPSREALPTYEFSGTRPLMALIVGGSAFPDVLDGSTAERLANDLQAHAHARGGTLAVHTSPRTSRAAVDALRRAIKPPHLLHVFGEGGNLYRPLLSAADEITVTSDSVSMVADALEASKPVAVYPLPQGRGVLWHTAEWLYRHAVLSPSPLLSPVKWLFDAGVMEASADRRLLFARLVEEKRIGWFGTPLPPPALDGSRQDLVLAADSLRALMK